MPSHPDHSLGLQSSPAHIWSKLEIWDGEKKNPEFNIEITQKEMNKFFQLF